MKDKTKKWITTAIVLGVTLLLGVIPSNVAYLIAQNRDVLLGRFSVERMTVLLLLIPTDIIVLYLTWANEKNKKKRQFQVMALCLSVVVGLVITDTFVRIVEAKRYVRHEQYYHRAPNKVEKGSFSDVPEKAFAYPRTPPGYPDIEYTLTVDKRGFRNKTDLEQYDVVVVGDSFAEGSNISDEQTWASLLAKKSNKTVYNLGMSAGHPGTYLETLKKFGQELSAKMVVCLLYEGNDFRDSNFEKEGLVEGVETYIKKSPIRRSIKDLLIRRLGRQGTNTAEAADRDDNAGIKAGDVPEGLSWLPVGIPDGADAKYYAFKVKRLLAHLEQKEAFLQSKGCRESLKYLRQMKKICDEKGIRFVVAYAPDKPHVLLPLLEGKVTPKQLYAFMSLKAKRLPAVGELMETVTRAVEVKESAIEQFCRQESIEFISLTQQLREATAGGRQTYFTYDQHWTPDGHQIVAEVLTQKTAKESKGADN